MSAAAAAAATRRSHAPCPQLRGHDARTHEDDQRARDGLVIGANVLWGSRSAQVSRRSAGTHRPGEGEVQERGQPSGGAGLVHHARAAQSFRDLALVGRLRAARGLRGEARSVRGDRQAQRGVVLRPSVAVGVRRASAATAAAAEGCYAAASQPRVGRRTVSGEMPC